MCINATADYSVLLTNLNSGVESEQILQLWVDRSAGQLFQSPFQQGAQWETERWGHSLSQEEKQLQTALLGTRTALYLVIFWRASWLAY